MKKLLSLPILLTMLLSVLLPSAFAKKFSLDKYSSSLDFAQVINVMATQRHGGSWCFNTSVRHNDQGWDHYADGWEVLDTEGNQLSYRLLTHPHDNEQPFTRSQCGIKIPDGVSKVIVRAKCDKHGFGGKPVVLDLKLKQGPDYTVIREL
jgi:hypothetical protein